MPSNNQHKNPVASQCQAGKGGARMTSLFLRAVLVVACLSFFPAIGATCPGALLGNIEVRQCVTAQELKLFESVPERLHKRDPQFVPPFPGSVVKLIDHRSPLVHSGGAIFPYVAYKNGKIVGRIAAIINPAHNKYYSDKTGFFGFFDFINDEGVADALLDTVHFQLERFSKTSMRGPYNPTVNDENGLLIEGFDSPPLVLMPYNPAYYADVYESLGLKPIRELHAYTTTALPMPDLVKKIEGRLKRHGNFELRSLDVENLDSEMQIIADLFNATMNRNWGFVPITHEELMFAAKDLKDIVDPSMVLIANYRGKPVAFSLLLPDVNEFMLRVRRIPRALGWLRMAGVAAQVLTRTPRQGRLAVLGVHPDCRHCGLDALFYAETLRRGQQFSSVELSWVEANNSEIIRRIQMMGGTLHKRYSIYEMPIKPAVYDVVEPEP